MIFEVLKSNLSSDFGEAETGNGAKKLVVLRREFFSLCDINDKSSLSRSLFFVHIRQFHFDFYCFFFKLLDQIFF